MDTSGGLVLIDDDLQHDDVTEFKQHMILMHKDVPVLDVMMADSYIVSVGHVYSSDHLPIMSRRSDDKVSVGDFSDWWQRRGISKHRVNLDSIFSYIPKEYQSQSVLQSLNLGLSLSDQYWMRPVGADVSWEQVNFFHNDFGHQLSDLCLDTDVEILIPDDVCLIGPSSSLGGNQKKAWKILNGDRYMVKISRLPYYQEAVNEVIGSDVCELFGIPHIHNRYLSFWKPITLG